MFCHCLLTSIFLLYVQLQAISAYGFEIVQTLIVDVEPDARVKVAMNEINAGNTSIFTSSELKKKKEYILHPHPIMEIFYTISW